MKPQKKNARPAPAPATPQLRVVGKEEAPATANGVRKLNLSSLVKPSANKATAKHPAIAVSDDTRQLLQQFLELEPRFRELEKQSKSLKAELAPLIKGDVFTHFSGTALDVSTVLAAGIPGLRLTIGEHRYSKLCTDDRAIITALATHGMELDEAAVFVGRHFRQATKLEVELDKVAEEKQEALVEAIVSAAESLGITEGITAKQFIAPRAGFHSARTSLLSPEQNQAIDAAIPVSAYPVLER